MLKKNKSIPPIVYPLALMVLIFAESSIPMAGGSREITFLTEMDPTLQNLLHIPLYGCLAFLWLRVFDKAGYSVKKTILIAFFITLGYGCLDEVHQTFVPGRFGGLLDIYLNGIGVVFSALFWWYQMKRKRFRISGGK